MGDASIVSDESEHDLRPLRIGVFGARGIPSTYSGYETFFTALLPALAERGHEVTIYTRNGDSEPYRGVDRKPLPDLPGKNSSTLSHGAIAAVRCISNNHDVLLVANVANSLFTWLPRLTGTPVVLNTDGQEWLRGKWSPTARRVFRMAAKNAKRTVTALISDSLEMQRIYRKSFGADSSVIPYAALALEPSHPTRLSAFGLADRQYLLVGGRLVPENNIDTVAETALQAAPGYDVAVIGATNYESPVLRRLQEIRSPRLKLLGHIDDRSDYALLVSSSALYLHGHSVGGINPSLLEAMALGADILALDTPFNREALGTTGSYFRTPEWGLESALMAELPRAAISDHRRRAAISRAHETFALERCVHAYETILHEAAKSRWGREVTICTEWEQELRAERTPSYSYL